MARTGGAWPNTSAMSNATRVGTGGVMPVTRIVLRIPATAALILIRMSKRVVKSVLSRVWRQIPLLSFGSVVVIGGVYIGFQVAHWWKYSSPLWSPREIASFVLDKVGSKPPYYLITSTFQDTPVQCARASSVTHPESAQIRNSASKTAVRIAASVGLDPYFVQCAPSDQRHGYSNSRCMYWPKDVKSHASSFRPMEGSLYVLFDVDQYIDMPEFLGKVDGPVLIYTFQPEHVANVGVDYTYTFDRDNRVRYTVAGAAQYQHMVWNWQVEECVVVNTCFGIPTQYTIYQVSRKRMAPDHYLVLLAPLRRWRNPFVACLATLVLENMPLQRLHVAFGDHLCLRVLGDVKGEGFDAYVSTGRVGELNSTMITECEFNALGVISETADKGIAMYSIKTVIGGDNVQAAPLLSYFKSKIAERKLDTIHPLNSTVRSYTFDPQHCDPDARQALVPFMAPLVDGCFAPLMNRANEARGVKARILDVRSDVDTDTRVFDIMMEFCVQLLPNVGFLHPTDHDEVFERQNRPTQRAILRMSDYMQDEAITRSFVKREAYEKCNDPRMISTLCPPIKREYSRYMYALTAEIEKQPWYAFSRSPVEVAECVVAVCEQATEYVTMTDFSRFDGRVSPALRRLEWLILTRAFAPQYLEELKRLHDHQFSLLGYTRFGVEYETGTSRASGSPETSVFNTIANAFVAYLAIRKMSRATGHIPAEQAWSMLGLYGGDDGITADIPSNAYKRASKAIGQQIETIEIPRGTIGVKFLSRCYGPDVWTGCPSSMCSISRQLAKFHATVYMPPEITNERKLLDKSYAYYLTDRNTPILGQFVSHVMQIWCDSRQQSVREFADQEYRNVAQIWQADLPIDIQYPNEPQEWYEQWIERDLPGFNRQGFEEWLYHCTTLQQVMNPPRFMEPPRPNPTAAVIVDGDVVEPEAVQGRPRRARGRPKHRRRDALATGERGVPIARAPRRGERQRRGARTGTGREATVPAQGRGAVRQRRYVPRQIQQT